MSGWKITIENLYQNVCWVDVGGPSALLNVADRKIVVNLLFICWIIIKYNCEFGDVLQYEIMQIVDGLGEVHKCN